MPDEIVIRDKRAVARATSSGGVALGTPPPGSRTARDMGLRGSTARMRRSGSSGDQGESEIVAEMRRNRRINYSRRVASSNASGGADIGFATGRSRDPMWYWQQNNLPYDVSKEEELEKARKFCRWLYLTHPIVASAVDIYSKYPLLGMELTCKDSELTDFYSTLFMDQLGYDEYLIDVGREYWTVGEAWPYGSFNEVLGVWEDDELLNPDDIEVHRTPFSRDPFFTMRLPQSIRDVLTKREPAWEYRRLVTNYPELLKFQDDRKRMPVSNVLLKQIRFKGDTFNPRGIPIWLRAIRTVQQEEMMMSAQDAVADRLYTPLILAKLGASATDLGTPDPWIPTDEDLGDFEEALDAALAGDFRMMVHHAFVDIQTVFGREQMPNLNMDFDRLTERILQTVGLSQTMLSGAGQGETYAADALNRDLITQLLSTFQRRLIKLYEDRAYVVAEAHQHYDYEVRGNKRYPIMEEVLVIDQESGEQRIEEQPKLLIPDLRMRTMNMRSEESERQFYEALRASGVPISMKTRLTNVPIDLDDEMERTREEQVKLTVEDLLTKKATYLALQENNLPIPDDLKALFEPKVSNADEVEGAAAGAGDPTATRLPLQGIDDPTTPALAPTPMDLSAPPGVPLTGEGEDGPPPNNVVRLPRSQVADQVRSRPPESDEARAAMPRASSRTASEDNGEGQDGDEESVELVRGGLFGTPRHVGVRRYAHLDASKPLDEQEEGIG